MQHSIERMDYMKSKNQTESDEVQLINEQDLPTNETEQESEDTSEKVTKKFFRRLSPKNVIKEINGLGYKFTFRNILIYFAAFTAAGVGLSFLLSLRPVIGILMTLVSYLFMPTIIVNIYRRKYNNVVFIDVAQYIEQMLYAFKNSKKIYKSLVDILPLFQTSPLYEDLKLMQSEILDYGNEAALNNFRDKYECEKITQLHKFLLDSENLGGEVDATIDLLIEDNSSWKERVEGFQKDRNKWRTSIFFAILISFGMCIIMEKCLPSEVNIQNNIIVQIATFITYILEFIIYIAMDNKLSKSYLDNISPRDDDMIKRYYEEIINYDKKKSFYTSIKIASVPLLGAIVSFVFFKNTLFAITFVGVALFILVTKPIKHKSHEKAIKEEITIQFPKWLMNMAILSQSNSIQVSLFKSIYTAPTVLKPELIKLNNALVENPTSIQPYFDFLKDFNMKEITSSMTMFYAIAAGTGADAQKQIYDIIRRTNRMVDKSERLANDNFLAGIYSLFLAPQMVGAAKLMIDMVVFFLVFMKSASSM